MEGQIRHRLQGRPAAAGTVGASRQGLPGLHRHHRLPAAAVRDDRLRGGG